MNLLNLDAAPDDSLERLLWLSGVMEEAKKELNAELQRTYFDVRVEQRLASALALGLHSQKRVLAWTRAENEARGRQIRWGDGY